MNQGAHPYIGYVGGFVSLYVMNHGAALVHRLHTGLYSLYIMNQGLYHYIDYVFGGSIP